MLMSWRDRQREATRALLLQTAARLVAAHGADAVTTRDVAREAGVAAGTVFAHFPDKSALFEALLAERIRRTLDAAFASAPEGFVDRVVHVSGALYAGYDAEPELARALIAHTLFLSAPERPLAAELARFQAWFLLQLGEATLGGRLRPVDPALAFGAFFSIYFGLLVAGLRGELPPEARLHQLRAFLLHFFCTQE